MRNSALFLGAVTVVIVLILLSQLQATFGKDLDYLESEHPLERA